MLSRPTVTKQQELSLSCHHQARQS
ncbi:hypothetical protein Nmel_016781, partial [Mimus melanotis]